jgi:3-(3-hydroxy-phenyl)propionate hydroxylase
VCPENHRRWEFKILPGEHFEGEISNEFLFQLLARWLTREQANIWRAAAYRFRAVVAEQWRKGRILLAGDAAHLMPPFLGQGMCQGIRDAANLDWKLDRVLRAQSPETLLDTYQIERRSHVYEVTKAAKMLGTIVGELDSDRARARDEKLIADQGGAVKPKLRQAFIPGIFDGLIQKQGGPSGRVFPQPFVKHGEELVRLDDLTRGRSVLMFRKEPERSVSIECARLAAPIGLVLATLASGSAVGDSELLVVRESENILSSWFEANGCAAALIRPDHYVYGTAKTDDESRALLLAYLEALACR